MYMKNHILAALRQELEAWEKVLISLNETEITAAPQPGEFSVKDEIAHLRAWQQRSIARMEAALQDREPQMPQWQPGIDPEDYENTDKINAVIFANARDLPWSTVYSQWHTGFLRLLELSEAIPEPTLLDSSRFAWLEGHALAFVLVATYDHHQEHLEKLQARLAQGADSHKNG